MHISVKSALNSGVLEGGSFSLKCSTIAAVVPSPSPAEEFWNAKKFLMSVNNSTFGSKPW